MSAAPILCPTDFSPSSDAALEYAAALAKQSGAILHVIHVDDEPLLYGSGTLSYVPDAENRKRLEAELLARAPDVDCAHHLLAGDPAEQIEAYADEHGVGMIVLGTHGRSGLSRLVMGSVAEKVVRSAKRPVLVVKAPDALQESDAGKEKERP
jgi:nucleotide-binding universal stress UspA family protein